MNFHKAPNTFTGEVHLNVADVDKSIRFYKEIIGFKVLEEAAGKVVLTADGKTPLLIIEQPENVTAKELRRTGLYHFALLLPERADLGKMIVHLSQNNIALGAADHKVSEAIYLSDPDGNGIEIYIDRDSSTWDWEAGEVEMTTDPLDAQGIVAESAGQPFIGLPTETIMGHVHLHVSNLQETEKFYNALGFEVTSHYPQALFMSSGKYHHHIALNMWNGVGAARPSENSVGLQSYALIYPDQITLDKTIAALNELGVKIESFKNGVITEDPSGNRIVLRVG